MRVFYIIKINKNMGMNIPNLSADKLIYNIPIYEQSNFLSV